MVRCEFLALPLPVAERDRSVILFTWLMLIAI
jgi:hypothetical protein